MEISNVSDAEFKTLVIRMFKEFSEWGFKQHKNYSVENEGYTNWNKEQFIGKQQQSGWSQESNQWFGT